jgi:hypothetical protein
MKKQNINTIDILIERLSENFSKVKNFDKLQESEEGRKIFDFIIKSISDMENFQSLFLNYYIPASNKSIVESWNQVRSSKYKHLMNVSKEDLKDNLYETIRLGYIGLFHKYESYLKALVDAVNFLFRELKEENNLLSVEDYCKKEFHVNIYKSHDIFSITKRINYISNCIKHWDGYPIKEPIHPDFRYCRTDRKIEIEKEIFKMDIDSLKTHCQFLMTQIIMIGFKQYFELNDEIIKKSLTSEALEDLETNKKMGQIKDSINIILSDFIQ